MAKYCFAVISDPHYFSPELTDGGRAYRLRSGSDQKCLLESGAIIDAAFKKIVEDDEIQAVLIPGDLTNDGEICSHEEFKEKLIALSKHKKVFVTTATHDFCCDNNARAYFGDNVVKILETADIPYLTKTYSEFGIDSAISVYENFNGLCSYVAKLTDGVRLFGLNDDQNGNGSSGYNEEHINWIVEQLNEAKKAGDLVVAMQHHVLIPHFNEILTKGGICCGDREKIAEIFASHGVDILFVGHSHWQNITDYTAQNGNIMTQVNVASLSGHPAPIFKVFIDDNEIEMHTVYVTDFEFNGKPYTSEYITEHSKDLISNVLTYAANGDYVEFSERLKALGFEPKKSLKFIFPLINRFFNFVNTANIGQILKKVNRLTLRNRIDENKFNEIRDEKVINIVYNIFTNLFDGGLHKYEKNSLVYSLVSDVVAIPVKFTSGMPFIPEKIKKLCTDIHELICLLMDDGTENNYKKIIIKRS